MSDTYWTGTETQTASTRPLPAAITRKVAIWSGTAVCVLSTNTALLFALLYWASVLE